MNAINEGANKVKELSQRLEISDEFSDFLIRNKLTGAPVNVLKELEEDFNEFDGWVLDERDECITSMRGADYEYDSVIRTCKEDGSIIYFYTLNDEWAYTEVYKNGEQMLYINSRGDHIVFYRDHHNNPIYSGSSKGLGFFTEYEYYENKQLKSITKNNKTVMSLPLFKA